MRPVVHRAFALAAFLSVLSAAAALGCNGKSTSSGGTCPSCPEPQDAGADTAIGPDAPDDVTPTDGGADAVGDGGCPVNPPTLQSSCSVSPLDMCTYGTPCQGGIAYYCSGFHWFAVTQVCNTDPPCPNALPNPGDSCESFSQGAQCPYGAMCADAGEAIATCAENEWSLVGAECVEPLAERTSPLCGTSATPTCDPDSTSFDAGSACHEAADGGSGGTGACRVTGESDGGVASGCATAGSGHDGAPCTSGASCAAGYECVGAAGSGVCRQYCCDHTCPGGGDPSNPPSEPDGGAALPFCDIEPLASNPAVAVPVCVKPPSTCVPFQPCPDPTQTCAIVDLVGTTACITAGPQGAGESCESANCSFGLTCWGVFPHRTCQELCDYQNAGCDGTDSCQYDSVSSAVDQGLGICMD